MVCLKVVGEPVEQQLVWSCLGPHPKIVHVRDQWLAEVPQPDVVHGDPGGQRIPRSDGPFGQGQPPSGAAMIGRSLGAGNPAQRFQAPRTRWGPTCPGSAVDRDERCNVLSLGLESLVRASCWTSCVPGMVKLSLRTS